MNLTELCHYVKFRIRRDDRLKIAKNITADKEMEETMTNIYGWLLQRL